MDQSKSSNAPTVGSFEDVVLPKRRFNTEFFVGLFTLVGVVAAGWLAVGLGGIEWMRSNRYEVFAEFDNVSGLKHGASVEIAGVPIGEVSDIILATKANAAKVSLRITNEVPLREDDIASIRTKGIIGDRYVKISRGGSSQMVSPGGMLSETESVVDIEDIIGKIVHSLGGNDAKDEGAEP
jgi:phospholipid/cholesterol/gamma-HCH transport system substrate-binding protein